MTIKGYYVAQIKIDLAIDGNTEGLLPFEEIYRRLAEGLTPMLKELIQNELGEGTEVTLTQTRADAWKEA